jgi:hypothetical protein
MQYTTLLRQKYSNNPEIAETAAREVYLIDSTVRHVCPDEPDMILHAVSQGKTFVSLKTYHNMRMGEARFYRTINKFYTELARRRKRIE